MRRLCGVSTLTVYCIRRELTASIHRQVRSVRETRKKDPRMQLGPADKRLKRLFRSQVYEAEFAPPAVIGDPYNVRRPSVYMLNVIAWNLRTSGEEPWSVLSCIAFRSNLYCYPAR
jgi:hypothetical protein